MVLLCYFDADNVMLQFCNLDAICNLDIWSTVYWTKTVII